MPKAAAPAKPQPQKYVTAFNPESNALIRRTVKTGGGQDDPEHVIRMQVPAPLPTSWGPTLRPYVPEEVHEAVLKSDACKYVRLFAYYNQFHMHTCTAPTCLKRGFGLLMLTIDLI